MRSGTWMAGVAATVLGLTSAVVLAQGRAANAEASSGSSLKGVVLSVSPVELLVKAEAAAPSSAGGKASVSSRSKVDTRPVHFAIKGAKITRGGWRPCEAKDIHKGVAVTVTFSPVAQAKGKFLASQVDMSGELSTADKEPILGKPGKVLLDDDFARPQMPPKWRPGKGFWEVADGVVLASENPADSHAATAHAEPRFPYKDIVAEFAFKFAGSTGCSLVMDDSNYKEAHAGHIIRASITPTSVQLADSKFGAMKNEIFEKLKDAMTSTEQKTQIQASIKDKAAAFKVAMEEEKWHQARVEVVGDEMLFSLDNQPVAYLKSEGVNHPTKNSIGFSVGGKAIQLDNVKVWEATPRDDWSKNRAAVQAVLQRKP